MTHPPSDPTQPPAHDPAGQPSPAAAGPFVPTQGIAPRDVYAQPYPDTQPAAAPPGASQYTQHDPYAPKRTQAPAPATPAPAPPAAPQAYPQPPQPDPYAQPQQPYGAPDPYAQPQPAYGQDPYAQPAPVQPYPPQPAYPQQPYAQQPPPGYQPPAFAQPLPAQPYIAGGYAGVPQPQSYSSSPYVAAPPPGFAPPADPSAGAYPSHGAYADRNDGHQPGSPPPTGGEKKSAWNRYAWGLLALLLIAVAILGSAQLKARKTEANVKPLVMALSHRNASARCPRYITSVLTNVGSVRLDSEGRIADRTDLTGPVCAGLRHLYSSGGTAELACLTNGGNCSKSALVSVVSISVVAHESMHLRGQLDEGRAECESIGESQTLATALKIPLPQARVISYLHYAGMNPYTPERYQVSASNCTPVAEFEADLPGDPAVLDRLREQTSDTWRELAT